MRKSPSGVYLKRAKEIGVDPNFFISVPYLDLNGINCYETKEGIILKKGKWELFPRLLPSGEHLIEANVWCDFEDWIPVEGLASQFLDYEYIYNPKDFLHIEGGKWNVFRKNVRKWPRRNENWQYTDDLPLLADVGTMMSNWVRKRSNVLEDALFLSLFAYFSSHPGIHRKFLYREGEVMGINAWDENWRYINYRICISKDGEDFLNEFMRWLFYSDEEILRSGKLVNDGGTVGNSGLEAFKDKLNPLHKRKRYSYIKTK